MALPGRQKRVKSPEEFEQRTLEYAKWCDEEGKKRTITGLALFLGFSDKQSIYDYCGYQEYKEVAKWARLVVENGYEENLHGKNANGSIFALKNFGWRDTQEHQLTGPDGGAIQYEGPKKMSLEEWNSSIGGNDDCQSNEDDEAETFEEADISDPDEADYN